MKKTTQTVTALLAAAALLLAAGCGRKETGPGGARIGDAVETAFLTFTVTGVDFSGDLPVSEEAGAPFVAPPPGMRYVAVHIQVKNTSDEEIPFYYDEFDLITGDDAYFPEPKTVARQLENDRLLPRGGSAEGELVYLVPADVKSAALEYQDFYEGDLPGERYRVQLNS